MGRLLRLAQNSIGSLMYIGHLTKSTKACLYSVDRVLKAPKLPLNQVRRRRARRLLLSELPHIVEQSRLRLMTADEKRKLSTLLTQVIEYDKLSRDLYRKIFYPPPILHQDFKISSAKLWLKNLNMGDIVDIRPLNERKGLCSTSAANERKGRKPQFLNSFFDPVALGIFEAVFQCRPTATVQASDEDERKILGGPAAVFLYTLQIEIRAFLKSEGLGQRWFPNELIDQRWYLRSAGTLERSIETCLNKAGAPYRHKPLPPNTRFIQSHEINYIWHRDRFIAQYLN